MTRSDKCTLPCYFGDLTLLPPASNSVNTSDLQNESLKNLSTRRTFLATTAGSLAASSTLIAADKPRIKIGQIGTKHPHAAGKLDAILKYPEIFEVVGIVEPDKERREAMDQKSLMPGFPG